MLVAAIAPWGAWRAAWPGVPIVDAVQVVFVDGDGMPAKDRRGLGKRTYGHQRGGVCMIGDPGLDGQVGVVEGLADALAVVARFPWTVAALCGTAGFRQPETARALVDAARVEIWADQDGPGAEAATALAVGLELAGVPVTARPVAYGKDAAAAAGPFPQVSAALVDAEAARAVAADGIPDGEARRQAAALLMEAAALDAETDEGKATA